MGANVLMAILADFMLVWLPAPTYALAAKKVGSRAPHRRGAGGARVLLAALRYPPR